MSWIPMYALRFYTPQCIRRATEAYQGHVNRKIFHFSDLFLDLIDLFLDLIEFFLG